jgi:hypothetical protein
MCPTSQDGLNSAFYPNKSSTYVQTKYFGYQSYGSGDLEGVFAFDDVRIGSGASAIHVTNATLGLIVYDGCM